MSGQRPGIYPGQQEAKRLRAMDSNGLIYNSVRDPGGECIAALRPRALPPVQGRHFRYVWNGLRQEIIHVLEVKEFGT